ncbi:MAG: hypothetical protein ACLT9V_00210 [Anaerococcus obesiensis]
MENVNNRIKLLCGEKYNLKMQREKMGAVITYKLKIIKRNLKKSIKNGLFQQLILCFNLFKVLVYF